MEAAIFPRLIGIRRREKIPTLPFPLFSVIPAKAGIPRKYSAERAHCRAGRPCPFLQGIFISAKERETRAFYAGFRLSRLCKNSENPYPQEKISHWHGKYPPKTA
ncbi:MAG: hypothetical protein OXU54_08695 [Gammaproteobacteria bacterium]|nr:hypothetical protein [Gammaproteobacteria bacterium]